MSRRSQLTGRARVAHELGVSERTASRWRRKGVIEVKQLGGPTSAWRVERANLDRVAPEKPKKDQ